MKQTLDRRTLLISSGAGAALGFLPVLPTRADVPARPSEPPPVSAYAASPLVDQIALSPDGKRVAMVSQNGDEKLLIYFDISEQKPTTIIIGPAKIRYLLWGDNDHVILVDSRTTSLPGGSGKKREFFLARCVNLKTAELKTLFKGQAPFYDIIAGDLHRIKTADGYRITASTYRLDNNIPLCLFSFAMDTSQGQFICQGSKKTQGFVLSPEGHPVAYSDFSDEHKIWELYYNQSAPGQKPDFKVIYTVKDALDVPSLEGLGRDGQSVVIFINKGEAEGEYHEISATGSLSEPLDLTKNLSSSPLFHPITKRLAGFSYRDDWISYDFTDPLLKKLVAALPEVLGQEYRSTIISYAEDPRKMIVYRESPTDAGSYVFIDFSTGDSISLANNYGALPEAWITQKTPFRYKAADGLDIHGYLTLPPNRAAKNLPLIVLPHGGPEVRDYINFDWQVQVLASRGYAVLQPNYRGSAGYGETFVDAGHGQFGRKMQTDLSDGVRELAKQGLIDPKRVAIFGASYGGYAALAGATLDTGIYNCAVSIAGLSDPKGFIEFVSYSRANTNSSSVIYWKQFLGDPKTYDEISPLKQAAKASCPILLIHGTDDTVVPISQSQRMEQALKAAKKPVEFITYKGQDHWETVGSSRIEMMNAALAFLIKYNPA